MSQRLIIVSGPTFDDPNTVIIERREGSDSIDYLELTEDEAHLVAYMLLGVGQGSYEELSNGIRKR